MHDGAVTKRVIAIGIVENGRVEILGDLREDEQVVIVGHAGLRDGSKVLASNADRSLVAG